MADNEELPEEEHGPGWTQNARGQPPDHEIAFTDRPARTAAQLATSVGGPYQEARRILRARWEADREAREAFHASVVPITKTDAFKRWLSRSRAVTENGSPKILFHGGTSGFDKFCSRTGPVRVRSGAEQSLAAVCGSLAESRDRVAAATHSPVRPAICDSLLLLTKTGGQPLDGRLLVFPAHNSIHLALILWHGKKAGKTSSRSLPVEAART
jgi:hypothetical protein